MGRLKLEEIIPGYDQATDAERLHLLGEFGNTPEKEAQMSDELTAAADEWRDTGEAPDDLDYLPGEHAVALKLVCQPDRLRNPVGLFLKLSNPVQRWVMRSIGWERAIGTRVG